MPRPPERAMRVAARIAVLVAGSLSAACTVSVHQHTAWPGPLPPVQVSRMALPPAPPPPTPAVRVPGAPGLRRSTTVRDRPRAVPRQPRQPAAEQRTQGAAPRQPRTGQPRSSTGRRTARVPRPVRPREVPRAPERRRPRAGDSDGDRSRTPRGGGTAAQTPPGRPKVLSPDSERDSDA